MLGAAATPARRLMVIQEETGALLELAVRALRLLDGDTQELDVSPRST